MVYSKVFSTFTPDELEEEIDVWFASVDGIEVLVSHFTTEGGRFSALFVYEDILDHQEGRS